MQDHSILRIPVADEISTYAVPPAKSGAARIRTRVNAGGMEQREVTINQETKN